MRKLELLVFAFAAGGCATAPKSEFVDRAVFEGYSMARVREAARVVLEDVAHPKSVVRARADRVVTEGRFGVCGRDVACGSGTNFIHQNTGTPWTTAEVRLEERGDGTTVRVDIEYETTQHCGDGYAEVTCLHEELGSTGALERRIIEGIRARLEGEDDSSVLQTQIAAD